jgi:hypothetical protein
MHSNAEDCLERKIVKLLDCSGLRLQTVEGSWKTGKKLWVEGIDFRHNRFAVLNVSTRGFLIYSILIFVTTQSLIAGPFGIWG